MSVAISIRFCGATTRLDNILGGSWDQTSGLQITNGGQTQVIDIQTAETVDDLLNIINGAGANVLAEINERTRWHQRAVAFEWCRPFDRRKWWVNRHGPGTSFFRGHHAAGRTELSTGSGHRPSG